MQISRCRLLLAAALAWAAYTPPAQAYIDPTAAGAALQSAYVVVASALMTLALVPKKVAAGFARLKGWLRPGAPQPPDGEA
ncbi:MAG: hypothetical protein JWM80_1221 [Cyanobacteria bacterium RYN_339]|nr:hypothetical protein [Cyanobacteria bacterium RYN_339]